MNISRVLLAQARPTMMNHSTSIYARCFDFNFNPGDMEIFFFILHVSKQAWNSNLRACTFELGEQVKMYRWNKIRNTGPPLIFRQTESEHIHTHILFYNAEVRNNNLLHSQSKWYYEIQSSTQSSFVHLQLSLPEHALSQAKADSHYHQTLS